MSCETFLPDIKKHDKPTIYFSSFIIARKILSV